MVDMRIQARDVLVQDRITLRAQLIDGSLCMYRVFGRRVPSFAVLQRLIDFVKTVRRGPRASI